MTMTRSDTSSGRSMLETAGFGFAGGLLLGYGIRRRGMAGSVLAGAGAVSLSFAMGRLRSARGQSFGQAETLIECSPSDAFRFCRQLSNLGSILPKEVVASGRVFAGESGGGSRLLESREDELLVWRTIQDRCQYQARMEFQPAYYGRGTSVSFSLHRYPVGFWGASDLQQQAEESLRRLKAVLEAHAGVLGFEAQEEGVETTEGTGWAPESGEPEERRFGYSRGDVSSRASEDVGYAPESGDRVLERGESDQSLSEAEAIEREAQQNRVLEGSEESFPASDAPSWTPGHT